MANSDEFSPQLREQWRQTSLNMVIMIDHPTNKSESEATIIIRCHLRHHLHDCYNNYLQAASIKL